jgi:signal peptidase I
VSTYDVPPTGDDTPADSQPASSSLLGIVAELFQTVLLALVIFLLIRNVVQNFRIDGISMEPNFHDGQFLFVNRFAYCPGIHLDITPLDVHYDRSWCLWEPKRGDVIVFHYPKDPSRDFIKRVIGLPGETVEIRQGKVFINGNQLPEPFGPNPGSYNAPPVIVAPDEIYVMGDNRNNSSDSHQWGPLPERYIVGKAWVSYWPPQYWSIVPHYDYSRFDSFASGRPASTQGGQ